MAKLKSIGYGHRQGGIWWKVKRVCGALIYIAGTMWAWVYEGGKIRRKYRKCIAEGRMFHVDRMFEDPEGD